MVRPSLILPPKPTHCKPVFLVGMNGSGTTMLRDSLCRHPDLYGFPRETRLLPQVLKKREAYGPLERDENFLRVWGDVRSIPAICMANGGVEPTLPDNWKDYPRDIEHVVDAVFQSFAKNECKVRWCEKTPQHVQHLPLLKKAFPEAKFVHIIRDGRECAASFHRRWKRNPKMSVYRWKKVVSKGRENGRDLGNSYFELRYEDITIDPEYWMRQICKHVGISFHPDVLLSKRPNKEGVKGTLGSIEPNTGKWRSYFSVSELGDLESIAGSFLSELGYPVVAKRGDEDPSSSELFLWRTADYVTQFRREMANQFQGENDKTWKKVIKLPGVALQQWRINKY